MISFYYSKNRQTNVWLPHRYCRDFDNKEASKHCGGYMLWLSLIVDQIYHKLLQGKALGIRNKILLKVIALTTSREMSKNNDKILAISWLISFILLCVFLWRSTNTLLGIEGIYSNHTYNFSRQLKYYRMLKILQLLWSLHG